MAEAEADDEYPEAVIVDSWLPDLDLRVSQGLPRIFSRVDLVTTSGSIAQESRAGLTARSCSMLCAARRTTTRRSGMLCSGAQQKLNPPIPIPGMAGPVARFPRLSAAAPPAFPPQSVSPAAVHRSATAPKIIAHRSDSARRQNRAQVMRAAAGFDWQNAPCMLDVSRRVRLVLAARDPGI